MSTLKLTLSKMPFDVMHTGEKPYEFRKPSKWIMSRLLNKTYNDVSFTNGYGADKPNFTCVYYGYSFATEQSTHAYSNGLKVKVEVGDVIIHLGKILSTKNIPQSNS